MDVRHYVKTENDLVDSIRHYNPKVYRDLSLELKSMLEKIFNQTLQFDETKSQTVSNVHPIRKTLYKLKKRILRN